MRIGPAPRLPRGAVDLGPAPAAATVSGAVLVRPRDSRALQSFISEVIAARARRLFGHYLSKGQFAARFGPAAASVAAVKAQLKSDGLQVGAATGDGLLVRFSGASSRVARAFATGLDSYRLADGRLARASTSAPALPASLASSVATVVGLDEVVRPRPLLVRSKASLATLRTRQGRDVPHTPKDRRAPAAAARPCRRTWAA